MDVHKEKSTRKRAIKGISMLRPQDWAPIEGKPIKDLAEKVEPLRIKASKYYMNNREKFINFINSKFKNLLFSTNFHKLITNFIIKYLKDCLPNHRSQEDRHSNTLRNHCIVFY